MSEIINFSINVAKIDKSRIKEVKLKDGSMGKFIDVSVHLNDEQDQYGNIASMSMGQTKEERDVKAPKTYLGNGKRVWASKPAAPAEQVYSSDDLSDDLPF